MNTAVYTDAERPSFAAIRQGQRRNARIIGLDDEQKHTLNAARSLSSHAIESLQQKEFISPEELRLLLYRAVDDEYSKP